ncbi:MAG: serine/threonine-protein phosphatase [Deltaproteobacteria bacterium]|nr:serine/threonine-protein phosphatase [Deltaproteobacteria bacterium]
MRVRFAGLSDVGRNRTNNEDNLFISRHEPICVVADGMGGHKSGEVASEIAVKTFRDIYDTALSDPHLRELLRDRAPAWPFKRRQPEHAEERRLVQATLLANQLIFDHASTQPDCRGMGTTLVGGYFLESSMYLVHVGDSRAYRLRAGRLERVTKDHSLADEYLALGLLSSDEADGFAYKNVITRAMGLHPVVEPEVASLPVLPGDLFLFCSDGLTDPLNDAQIATILGHYGTEIDQASRALIDAANAGGGPDNITVILAAIR